MNFRGITVYTKELNLSHFVLSPLQEEDATYAINFRQHIILNLTEENFNLKRLKKQSIKQIERHKHLQLTKHTSRFSGKAKLRDAGGGSHGEKREWEVGTKDDYENIDDGHHLKR